jgi:hypothetical protein
MTDLKTLNILIKEGSVLYTKRSGWMDTLKIGLIVKKSGLEEVIKL